MASTAPQEIPARAEAPASAPATAPAAAPRWAPIALIGANALLATGPLFVRIADVGPVAAGFWRLALGLPVLTALALLTGGHRNAKISPAILIAIIASGTLFAADLASWHLGIRATKLANATLFGNCSSLIYPLYGYLVIRAWPSLREGGALAIAAIGAALLMGRSFELSPAHLEGDLLSLAAGVFYTGYLIAIARVRAVLAPLPLLAASTLASAIPMLGFAAWMNETIWPQIWWPLVALAMISQVVGQGLMVAVLGQVRPVVVGLTLLTQPVIAATIGWIVFGERLAALDIVGALLIAAALVLATLRS